LDSLSTPIPVKDLVGAPFTNTLNDTLLLDLTEINGTISNSILIPSNSTFLVSDLSDPALPAFFRSSPRTFDLVVLDPPWPNRSAERKATYDLVPDIVQIWANLAFLKDVVSKDGVIGIWCTNRAAHRTAAERFLKDMGFEVAEEWIWGKVTTKGEWSVPLEGGVGNGRRPYEVMLVGRQKAAEMRTVTRKVVFAVPELEHSRKPGGWNNLLTEHVFDVIEPSERMCAELFARELRSGWWSWGNECLKFQDLRYWDEVGDEEAGFVG
jgi:N6-adenosine-specific RNA methylase IME4